MHPLRLPLPKTSRLALLPSPLWLKSQSPPEARLETLFQWTLPRPKRDDYNSVRNKLTMEKTLSGTRFTQLKSLQSNEGAQTQERLTSTQGFQNARGMGWLEVGAVAFMSGTRQQKNPILLIFSHSWRPFPWCQKKNQTHRIAVLRQVRIRTPLQWANEEGQVDVTALNLQETHQLGSYFNW